MSIAGRELRERDKRIRAEVLEACSERIDLLMENIGNYSDEFGKKRPFKTWDRDDWEAAALRLLSDVQDALDNLHPAASDLEALLREARLNEANAHSTAFNLAMAAHKPEKYAQWRKERITELEKARARASEGEESTGS